MKAWKLCVTFPLRDSLFRFYDKLCHVTSMQSARVKGKLVVYGDNIIVEIISNNLMKRNRHYFISPIIKKIYSEIVLKNIYK